MTIALTTVSMTAERKYNLHKNSAVKRGISFDLTFNEWLDIWQQSGHWNERGRTSKEYVMSRYGDIGPYGVSNVFIQTQGENTRESSSSEKMKQTLQNANFNMWHSPEYAEARIKHRLNSKKTEQFKEDKRIEALNRAKDMLCPHCQQYYTKQTFSQYHNDKCKLKEIK